MTKRIYRTYGDDGFGPQTDLPEGLIAEERKISRLERKAL